MEDFWRPIIEEEYFAVRQPAIEANNFESKPTLITMVQQHQFIGHPSEDPNEHMGRLNEDGQHIQAKWGETISNIPLFTERCGSNMV